MNKTFLYQFVIIIIISKMNELHITKYRSRLCIDYYRLFCNNSKYKSTDLKFFFRRT